MNLRDFLAAGGHGSTVALAKAIGAHAPDVSRWASGARPVPEKSAVAIERHTQGAVTRAELRPDDYWLIWPDLPAPANQPTPEKEAA